MSAQRLNPGRATSPEQPDRLSQIPALVAIVAVCALGLMSMDQIMPSDGVPQQSTKQGASTPGVTASFSMWGLARYTCVVDRDTVWYEGMNLRLPSYDTPEPYDDICGGPTEVALAKRASAQLLELLNANALAVETFGVDGPASRTLATLRIAGKDIDETLIEEGLVRRWPDGEECRC